MWKGIIRVFLIMMLVGTGLSAQTTSSVYSAIGIGDLRSTGFIPNDAMGGIGISNGSAWYINHTNPALLTYNQFTDFEFGLSGESRTLSSNEQTSTLATGGLQYIALAIPAIPNRWTMSVSLTPYSSVNYDIFLTDQTVGPDEDSLVVNRNGEGGLVLATWSNGVRVFDNFSVGLKASYVFGNITRESISEIFYPRNQFIIDPNTGEVDTVLQRTSDYQIAVTERESYNDFLFELGALYTFPFSETNFLNVGATYQFKSNINTEVAAEIERRTSAGDPFPTNFPDRDTLVNGLEGSVLIPARLGVGVSYNKLGRFTLGLDYVTQDWSDFRIFEQESASLRRGHYFAVGSEFTPDPTNVDSYFSRITYRVGVEYDITEYEVRGQGVNDFGINFGVSLPVAGFSSVNLGFKLGQRGSNTQDLVREQYFQFKIGASFNSSRWAKLPRYN